MAKRPASPLQAKTIKERSKVPQISFNAEAQDDFVSSHGVSFIHYRAMPSPIGLKDRGDYRRSDSLDTISSNGFVYKKCGVFTAVMMGNGKRYAEGDGGMIDQSTARITLPRFYDIDSPEHANEQIHLAPGDRIYIKDLEVSVVNYQRVDYNISGDDFLQYPALCVEFLMDSQGIDYKEGVDFKVNRYGNIDWIDGKNKPGIDPETGNGRVYSIRYRYNAFWYIANLINEIRVVNITDGATRKPERMAYQAMIQREYVYHNQVNDGKNENKAPIEEKDKQMQQSRVAQKPTENIDPNKYKVKVNVSNFE